MKLVELVGFGKEERTHLSVFLLQETTGKKVLPVLVNPLESMAVISKFTHLNFNRPMTHDLIKSIADVLGINTLRVEFYAMAKDGLRARICCIASGKTFNVECRPNDALALAVRFEAPIYAEENLLTTISFQQESGESKWRGILENLKPEDLKKA